MKKGFTLAEVLITLSIVGVIAVLTIPSMVKGYKYKLYAASLKKTYAQIENAMETAMSEEMTSNFAQTTSGAKDDNVNCTKGACYFLKNYFKVARDNCGVGNNKCVADEYKSTTGVGGMTHFGYCIQTTNGAAICMYTNPNNHVTSVFIDVNGEAEPNITGIDTFVMNIKGEQNALVDWADSAKCNTKYTDFKHAADYASGCLDKVMRAGWKIED